MEVKTGVREWLSWACLTAAMQDSTVELLDWVIYRTKWV